AIAIRIRDLIFVIFVRPLVFSTVTPIPTNTSLPTDDFTSTLSGSPTNTMAPTQSVGYTQPIPLAKFRGNFDGGTLVFTTNSEGDRVANLRIGYMCFGKAHELNFARVSMKIINSSFAAGSGDFYVQGQFTSPTTAKGGLNGVLTEGKKECKFNSVIWSAAIK
ncbi:hypothetical protein ACFLUA_03915, partial [Chloroflexota bacterium]